MKVSKFLFVVFLLLEYAQAIAYPSKILPQPPELRPEGVSQSGGTCHATAFLTALEHHFQRENKPVKLSVSYFAYSLKHIIDTSYNEEGLSYDPRFYDEESHEILLKHGSVVPHYMHPEENRMRSPYFSHGSHGVKYIIPPSFAHIPENYKVGWPKIKTKILSHDLGFDHSFVLGKNKDPIDLLKGYISKNQVAVLYLGGEPSLKLFDNPEYKKKPLLEATVLELSQKENSRRELSKDQIKRFYNEMSKLSYTGALGHAFALVGYDDSLYANHGYKKKGGFILKGTWDDTSYQYASLPYQMVLDLVALNEKRAKDYQKDVEAGRRDFEGGKGDSIFIFKLEYLDLPKGFDEEVHSEYQKYADEDEFQLFYYPHIFIWQTGFPKAVDFYEKFSDYDFSSLSEAEDREVRSDVASLLRPWDINVPFSVGVFSGWQFCFDAIQNKTLSKYYKANEGGSVFPNIYDISSFNQMVDYDHSFFFRAPDDLEFWEGLFYSAKLRYMQFLKASQKGGKDEL